VSDFSLIDAIEAGIVKIPRLPVADDAMVGQLPIYRDLWSRIRRDLPRSSRRAVTDSAERVLPAELEGALQSLHVNYRKTLRRWVQRSADTDEGDGSTPPVFIVVCNNTAVSKLVFDYIAGWEKRLPDGTCVLVPGKLDDLSNVLEGASAGESSWRLRPRTILIDSRQLESGEAMSAEFKRLARLEIEEFKAEYRARFPGRDVEALTDEDLLREVMNTVGKPGKLGEQICCVVSVSMLTEGWDANTVTHILGIRAFGTQLLCEQVVGRGLRRRSYALDPETKHFTPEYAEVYGVPFSFLPAAGSAADPAPTRPVVRVRALPERAHRAITFPQVMGYRYEIPDIRLRAVFDEHSRLSLSSQHVPTMTEIRGIVGEQEIHELDQLRGIREQTVAYELAKHALDRFRDGKGNERPWLFPQVLRIVREWLRLVEYKDNTFSGLLLLGERKSEAADRVYNAVLRGQQEDARREQRILPILRPNATVGSTSRVAFDTSRVVYATDPTKCHVSHVAEHSAWESKVAAVLEHLPTVHSYVKNDHLGFVIPYTLDGDQRDYEPDFLVRINDGHGPDDLLNLIVEVSGAARRDKTAKVETARLLWVPAVNNHGGFGRWDFLEITDPYTAGSTLRAALRDRASAA
jgi:type III restriction enzyme